MGLEDSLQIPLGLSAIGCSPFWSVLTPTKTCQMTSKSHLASPLLLPFFFPGESTACPIAPGLFKHLHLLFTSQPQTLILLLQRIILLLQGGGACGTTCLDAQKVSMVAPASLQNCICWA